MYKIVNKICLIKLLYKYFSMVLPIKTKCHISLAFISDISSDAKQQSVMIDAGYQK